MNEILLVIVLCWLIGLFYCICLMDYFCVIFSVCFVILVVIVGRDSCLVLSVVSVIFRLLFFLLIKLFLGILM